MGKKKMNGELTESKFDHLRKLSIERRTAWFDLPWVAARARVEGLPADSANKGWLNARLRAPRQDLVSVPSVERNRDSDRSIYAWHVLVGWSGISDTSGADVPFSPENAEDFLEQLPAWIFDRMRAFFMSPENFLPEDAETSTRELSGNSFAGSSGT